MREYIFEKVKNTTRHFDFGNVEVNIEDPLPPNINLKAILKSVEKTFPSHYFHNLKGVKVKHSEEFDKREVNAVYRDGIIHVTNQQDNAQDILDDIVHEFAHHMETIFPELIYSDKALIKEFLQKRHQLEFELKSEGYWTDEYDFNNLKFDDSFDKFLYKRVGPNLLKMLTAALFIRPYASVSLREYFATGFEAYYLGNEEILQKISPVLFDKIKKLHYYRV
jgi:hypothetical protein